MDPSTALSRSAVPHTIFIVTTTAVVTVTLILLARLTLWPQRAKVLPNPLKTMIAHIPSNDARDEKPKRSLAGMIYHPDVFPGARDVETPYGTIRVYEFGPEDGSKVLLVHGISTPCVVFASLAKRLVERGCRVMLFDLFGRGFSDGVGDLPHDARLYVSQILLVLASSPLSWTGDGALRLIGYSLGGGIAVHFAAAFPRLVSSLVLLAPAGLIRASNFGTLSGLLFRSGLVPERILARLTSIRLRQPIAASRKHFKMTTTTGTKTTTTTTTKTVAVAAAAAVASVTAPVEAVAAAEASRLVDDDDDARSPPEDRILRYVGWMVAHHAGFLHAFMSSIRYAPLTDQHDSWRLLAARDAGSTLVLLAEDDKIIEVDEYKTDGIPLTGSQDRVEWRVIPGSHDVVITHSDRIMAELDQWWGRTRDSS